MRSHILAGRVASPVAWKSPPPFYRTDPNVSMGRRIGRNDPRGGRCDNRAVAGRFAPRSAGFLHGLGGLGLGYAAMPASEKRGE